MNTKIEPNFDGSKKVNVVEGTILEPNNSNIVAIQNDIYKQIVLVMNESINEYYNMKIALGLKCE